MYANLAWRNIWRNSRRTTVILIAIVIGVWSMIALGSLMRGMMINMIDTGIATLTGEIQVHAKGYHADPVVENSVTDPAPLEAALDKALPPGSHWTPRVRVNAIVSNARHSTGVTMVGIDSKREAAVSFLKPGAIVEGRDLTPDDKYGLIVGRAMLKKMQTKVGYKVVLMSQGTDKQIASRAFRIVGVFATDMQATEKEFLFVSLPAAQEMLKLKDGISEVSIILPDQAMVDPVAAKLAKALPNTFEVQTWIELLPLLRAYVSIFDGFIYIWYLVVFVAMAFGIVNTMLMAVFERIREFGLMKALGMRPVWIIREVITESFFLLVIGVILGNLLALASIWALDYTGINLSALAAGSQFFGMSRILYPVLSAGDVVIANVVVFILGMVVAIYPAVKAARFTPVEAMTHL